MASYDEILKRLQNKKYYQDAEDAKLSNVSDVINYAQNNNKTYQELTNDYIKSKNKTKSDYKSIQSTLKKGNVSTSDPNNLDVSLSTIARQQLNQKAWEKTTQPTTKAGIPFAQNQKELQRQQEYIENNVKNTDKYEDYTYRKNKLNPTLEYAKNVAQVKEQGVSGVDKVFAPILSGVDNIKDLGGSFKQDNGSRVNLPSLNDLKTQKAIALYSKTVSAFCPNAKRRK